MKFLSSILGPGEPAPPGPEGEKNLTPDPSPISAKPAEIGEGRKEGDEAAPPKPRQSRARKTLQRQMRAAARSPWLARGARGAATAVLLFGLVLIFWGMTVAVNAFSSDLAALARYAGGGSAVVSSAASAFQVRILASLGLANPDNGGATDQNGIPDTSSGNTFSTTLGPAPTLTPFQPEPAGADAGFVPYQIPVSELQKRAPALVDPLASTAAHTPVPETPAATQVPPTAIPPTATPEPPAPPDRIVIPRINLDAPVVLAPAQRVVLHGQVFEQWNAPNFFAAGWQEGSAMLGEPGNTVINGHHNIDGMVFGSLLDLVRGDEIIVYSGKREFHYVVSQTMKLYERDASLTQREDNARWILPSTDERLTLVTCWPPVSNTYRLIVVAVPIK